MASNSTHMRSNSVHEDLHIFLSIGIVNSLKDSRSELHNAGAAVSNDELRASKLLSELISGILLSSSVL